MATDFLQLFAQEMSAFSRRDEGGFWFAQDLNSPFCNGSPVRKQQVSVTMLM